MDSRYERFRNNPFINTIAEQKKWTVSTSQKMPLDMYAFLYRQQICGAKQPNDLFLMSLDGVHSTIPAAANFAFYLDALYDKFVILDIEPSCPSDIRDKLVAMPCLYCETSMSGKGVHMVFPLPEDILDKYPDAREKVALKEEHKYYEILLNHYVTFTANQIPANLQGLDADFTEFRKLFEDMSKHQKTSIRADVEIEQIENVNAPLADNILKALMSHRNDYRKTLEDFNMDQSKYEFGYIACMYRKLRKMLDADIIKKQQHTYTDSEMAWFLYKVASAYLPPRAKHEEKRNGMPWLLYLSGEVIARCSEDDQNAKKKE